MGGSADEKAPAGELLETSPFAGDLDAELAAGPRRGLSRLTLVLGAGVVLVVGVILGIQAQKALGGQGGTAGDPAAAMRQGVAGGYGPGGQGGFGPGGQGGFGPGGQGGFGPGGQGGFGPGGQGGYGPGSGGYGNGGNNGNGGFGGFGGRQQGGQGAQGGVTFGTVQRVEGGKVYLQQPDGTVVTVNTTGQTTVRVSKQGKVTDLTSGGTVVVQGTKGADGSITATAINEGGGRR
ncbi:hypothetical protein AB0395_02880 [Streptosporangium sp. NPDC051023]|uniref:hypothetical protein n=1 Tax=Streptosporangium sp. NPDC051023 TaxID=3155410 RepID=UPI00344EA443